MNVLARITACRTFYAVAQVVAKASVIIRIER